LEKIFKNKEVSDFVRIGLLLFLFAYILFRILGSMDLFIEEINCGAEKVVVVDNKEYFLANSYRFDNANGRSSERAFEGSYSVKLTPQNQYGLSITLGKTNPQDVYEGSVWFYENKTEADTTGWPFLVACIGKQFWKGTTEIVQKKDGWGKLEFKITIPDSVYKDPLVVYCWNNTKNTVYFDNMTIRRKNCMKFLRQQ